MIFLRTSEGSGSCFIRTDQLDGETDWKLRLAIQATQHLESDRDLFDISAQVYAEKPQKDIHNFIGTFSRVSLELFVSSSISEYVLFPLKPPSLLLSIPPSSNIKVQFKFHRFYISCRFSIRNITPYETSRIAQTTVTQDFLQTRCLGGMFEYIFNTVISS